MFSLILTLFITAVHDPCLNPNVAADQAVMRACLAEHTPDLVAFMEAARESPRAFSYNDFPVRRDNPQEILDQDEALRPHLHGMGKQSGAKAVRIGIGDKAVITAFTHPDDAAKNPEMALYAYETFDTPGMYLATDVDPAMSYRGGNEDIYRFPMIVEGIYYGWVDFVFCKG